MIKQKKWHRCSIVFMLVCLILLFLPGIGDARWMGFIGFTFIAIPWYILSLKDLVKTKIDLQEGTKKGHFKFHSLTLLLFGLVCIVFGVSIDLIIIYGIYNDSNTLNLVNAFMRLLFGFPFFGFGLYLANLAIGREAWRG